MSLPDLWTYSPPEHKGAHLAKQRVIYFGPRCIELLRPWLRADGKCLFSPVESEEKRNGQRKLGRSTPMTPSQRRRRRKRNRVRPWGERYSTSNYRNSIYRACRKAGIKPWGPNRLRHTRATEVRKEFGLEAAQIFLGHVRCDTTEIYAERDTRLGKEVAKKIG
jgi:integrase